MDLINGHFEKNQQNNDKNMKETENKSDFKYTVFEHIQRGTRFYTDYSETAGSDELKIVKHCITDKEAEAECEKAEERNFFFFWKDTFDSLRHAK
jgi:hypothetical protein